MIATLKDANDYDQIDNYYLEMHFPKRIKEKKTRQFEAIRKGIIRKFARLEREKEEAVSEIFNLTDNGKS